LLDSLDWSCFLERPSRYEVQIRPAKSVLVSKRTPFQHVGIMDLQLFGKTLVLDGDIQSARQDEFIYHETLVHPAMLMGDNPSWVLILGGGEGAVLREVYRHRGVARAVMVDIDEELVQLCREHLPEWSCGAFEDPRTEVHYCDALKWVEDCSEKFDVIIHDLIDPKAGSPAKMLFSRDFFRLLKSRLNPGGVIAMQASRIDLNFHQSHRDIYNTLRPVFSIVRPYQVYIPSFYNEWGFITASDTQDPLTAGEEEVDARTGERIEGSLRFYDGQTHRRIFSLPLTTRRLLAGHDPGEA
jgi:spermidine synthase